MCDISVKSLSCITKRVCVFSCVTKRAWFDIKLLKSRDMETGNFGPIFTIAPMCMCYKACLHDTSVIYDEYVNKILKRNLRTLFDFWCSVKVFLQDLWFPSS